jgi:hypothetical protein
VTTITRFLAIISMTICFCPESTLVYGATQAAVQTPTNSIEALPRFAYVFSCGGKFVRINLETGKYTTPANLPTFASVRGDVDGCLIDSVVADLHSPIIYALSTKEIRVNENGKDQYQILSIHLPDMKVVDSLDIGPPVSEVPRITLDVARQELVAVYNADTANGVASNDTVQFISLNVSGALKRKHEETISVLDDAEDGIGERPYFDKLGNLVDEDRIFSRDGSTVASIDPYALLTPSVQSRFQELKRRGVNGKQYLDVEFADSAAGWAAFIVGWDAGTNPSSAGGGIIVADVENGETVSSFTTPFREAPYDATVGTPTVHLTRDGQKVLVEEYEWNKKRMGSPDSDAERTKTGKIAIYEASSGTLLRTVELIPQPGDSGQVIGFSPNSDVLLYSSSQVLYTVDLESGASRTIPSERGFVPIGVIFSPE